MEGHEGGFLTHGGFEGHGFVAHGGYHDENPMARQFTPESPGVPTPEPMPENGLNGPMPGMRQIIQPSKFFSIICTREFTFSSPKMHFLLYTYD